ncbi:MAG: hypothetical protein Kow00117_05650 [Phototrophicales bacterium]
MDKNLDLQVVLDGLGQGVLIFDDNNKLVLDNLAARTTLGTDLNLIRRDGWQAAETLFNAQQTDPDKMVQTYRDQALQSAHPVRFYILRSGEYIPCWIAGLNTTDGKVYTMVTLDSPDWAALNELVGKFHSEVSEAIQSTQGHIDLIEQTIAHHKPQESLDTLTKRVMGFSRLINIHMARVARLMDMLDRLQKIRTGEIKTLVKSRRRKIDLVNFIEDLVEELDEISLVDPETDAHDHRSRLTVNVPNGLAVSASSTHLTRILQDILRNAIMYSMKATPIRITVEAKGQNIQIAITDEGYGIRERERDRVFQAFKRARQPQIISEFGYGLNLYLCKHEVEAMNGQLWFESTENVGTTFYVMLPAWRESSDSASSASNI